MAAECGAVRSQHSIPFIVPQNTDWWCFLLQARQVALTVLQGLTPVQKVSRKSHLRPAVDLNARALPRRVSPREIDVQAIIQCVRFAAGTSHWVGAVLSRASTGSTHAFALHASMQTRALYQCKHDQNTCRRLHYDNNDLPA